MAQNREDYERELLVPEFNKKESEEPKDAE